MVGVVVGEREVPIPGVKLLELTRFEDTRGGLTEIWREDWLPGSPKMLQANKSESRKGVLRGLHYHLRQSDYWVVMRGRISVCLLDVRAGSPAEGRSFGCELSADQPTGLFIPPGVAHGFYAISDATLMYLVDALYDGTDEFGVAWDDPGALDCWPDHAPVLSERDSENPRAADIKDDLKPAY